MPRRDGRVEPGQPLATAFSARAWNRAQDAADQVLGQGTGTGADSPAGPHYAANIVLIRNDSNARVGRHGVLGISGVAIDPTPSSAAAREFSMRPVLTGITPIATVHADRFVVTLEPIEPGKIGRAAAGGVFACRVNVTDNKHEFATVRNGDSSELASTECGVLQLLWKQGLGSQSWAVGCM